MKSGTGRSATVDSRNAAQPKPIRASHDGKPNKSAAQESLGSPPPSPSIHASPHPKSSFLSKFINIVPKKGSKSNKPSGSNATEPVEEPRFDSNESVSPLVGDTPATTSETVRTDDAGINHENETIGGLTDVALKEKLQNVANRLIQDMDITPAAKKSLMDQLQSTEKNFEMFKSVAEKAMEKLTPGLGLLGDMGKNVQSTIDGLMTAIDTVSEIHPIMKLTWMVLSYGYKKAKEQNATKHEFEAFLTLYMQIRQRTNIIEGVSTTDLGPDAKQLLQNSMNELQESLIASVELYLQYAQESCFGKLSRKYGEELDTLNENLKKVFQNLRDDAQLVSYLKIDQLLSKLEEAEKKLDNLTEQFAQFISSEYHIRRLPDYFLAHVSIGELAIFEQLKKPVNLADLKKKIDERARELKGADYGLFMEDKDGNHVRLSNDEDFQQMCEAYPEGRIHVDGLEIGAAVDVIFPSDNLVEISEIRAESAFDVMFSYW
ncbi:hypothetical protein HDU81_007305 [Chytriomyces hyalinus]|nr:hypothetical protein HDU81_007305 [Chytriomyces hyalinus]